MNFKKNPVDAARKVETLSREGMAGGQIASRIGCDAGTVSRLKKLSKLDKGFLDICKSQNLSFADLDRKVLRKISAASADSLHTDYLLSLAGISKTVNLEREDKDEAKVIPLFKVANSDIKSVSEKSDRFTEKELNDTEKILDSENDDPLDQDFDQFDQDTKLVKKPGQSLADSGQTHVAQLVKASNDPGEIGQEKNLVKGLVGGLGKYNKDLIDTKNINIANLSGTKKTPSLILWGVSTLFLIAIYLGVGAMLVIKTSEVFGGPIDFEEPLTIGNWLAIGTAAALETSCVFVFMMNIPKLFQFLIIGGGMACSMTLVSSLESSAIAKAEDSSYESNPLFQIIENQAKSTQQVIENTSNKYRSQKIGMISSQGKNIEALQKVMEGSTSSKTVNAEKDRANAQYLARIFLLVILAAVGHELAHKLKDYEKWETILGK